MSFQERSCNLGIVSHPSETLDVTLPVLTWRTSYLASYFAYFGGVSSRCFVLGGP
jgi:hypothetical protein